MRRSFVCSAAILALVLAVGSAFAFGDVRDCRAELPDVEYEAFVAEHGGDVCFLGVNMYPTGKVCHAAHESPVQIVSSSSGMNQQWREKWREELSRPVAGHTTADLCTSCDDRVVQCLEIGETNARKFSLGADRHWVEKTAGEITALTGIPIAVDFVWSNECVCASGTNAALWVRVAASAMKVYKASSCGFSTENPRCECSDETSRRIVVTPLFRRKPKPVPKSSEIPEPVIDVDI